MKERSKIYGSFEELYRDNEETIFRYVNAYARRAGLPEQDRDDLAEQVWSKVSDKALQLLTMGR